MIGKDQDNSSEVLHVAVSGKNAFIQIFNRGTFKESAALKKFGMAAMEAGAISFVFDMRNCVGMDSTFMGVIAGLALRANRSGGEVLMINLSVKTRGLLGTLGLDRLIRPYMIKATPKELDQVFSGGANFSSVIGEKVGRAETAEAMLEAHETLVEILPDNLPRFKDVLTYLRKDLGKTEDDI